MINIIQERLFDIEQKEGVAIFYACESGSRAWGFPSANSDYDVRFLYARPVEWYLSIADMRDVIEYTVNDQLDINGWDIKKALQLFRKSNPPLFEWLGSPIVYKEQFNIAEKMRALAKEYYSPLACIHHYLHMAEGNYREYLKGDEVWIKKYFYVLRPLLAIQWIEQGKGVAPTAFSVLVDQLLPVSPLRTAIEDLIKQKRAGAELDRGPRIPVISEFIDSEIERLIKGVMAPPNAAPIEEMNHLFRSVLHTIWGNAYNI
ncbi:MAG: nucleotidyltransferase domain-containing protein [Nitrospirota bacterium]|nr:nucleotidyltransferase domain-containing protein [Nitrospirota bacterium]